MSSRGRSRARARARPARVTRPVQTASAKRPEAVERRKPSGSSSRSVRPQWATLPARLGCDGWALILLLAVPAVIVPGALNRFVFGKLAVASLGVGLAFLAAPKGRLSSGAAVLLGAGGAILTISAMTSRSPLTAFLGRDPQLEGVLVIAVYVLAAASGARLLGVGASDSAMVAARSAMALTAIAVAGLAVAESFGLRPLSANVTRPGSLLGNASDEGAFAVLYAGPLLVEALRARRSLSIVGAAAAVVTVALSGSRGALVGLVVTILVVAVASGARARWVTGGGLAGLVALVMAVPASRNRVLELSPLSRQTVTGRFMLWRETLSLAAHHPILGVGPSQFENAIVGEHSLRWQETIGPSNPPASPHNLVLQALMAGGALLLIAALALALLIAREGLRQMRSGQNPWALGALAGLGGYAAALLFHLTSPGTTIPAAVLGGSLLAVPLDHRALPHERRWPGLLLPAGCVLLVACFLCGALSQIWLRRGDVAVGRGQLASANRDFNLARDLLPWDPDLPGQVFHQFVASALAGNSAAVSYARRWDGRANTGDEQVLENRAALLELTGDFVGSQRLVSTQLRIDPHNPQFLLLQGVNYANLHSYAQAETSLAEAARIDPTDPDPWQDLALVYKAEGRTALESQAQAIADRLRARIATK